MALRFSTPRINATTAWHNIGSPVALSNRALALFAMPSVLTFVIQNEQRFGGSYLIWMVLSAAVYLASIAPMLIARPWLLKLMASKPRPFLVSLLFLFSGLVRGFSVLMLGGLIGVVPTSDVFYRLTGGPLFVAGSMVIIVLFLASQVKHEQALLELEKEKMRLDELRGGIRERIRIQLEELLAKVRITLAPTVSEVYAQLKIADDSSSKSVAKNLMQAVEEVVRPLSHDLGRSQTERQIEPQLATLGAIKAHAILPERVALGSMLLPGLSMLGAVLIATPTIMLAVPGLAGLGLSLTIFVANYLALSLLRLVFLKVWAPVWVGAFFSLFAGVVANGITWLILAQLQLEIDGSYTQAGVMYSVITVLTFAQQLARTRRFDSESKIRGVIADLEIVNSQLRQEAWLNRKRLASVLHGPVQAALYASAMRLAQSKQISSDLISGIEVDLNQALNKLESFGETENFDIVLAQISDVWNGVCDIQFEISEQMRVELRGTSSVAVCVLEVIREGISNAIKHGGATDIHVLVKPASREGLILVEISNNGRLPDADSEAGYGSQFLSEITYSWSIGTTHGRTLLRAKLAR
jgi:signal transduction histidine kinase